MQNNTWFAELTRSHRCLKHLNHPSKPSGWICTTRWSFNPGHLRLCVLFKSQLFCCSPLNYSSRFWEPWTTIKVPLRLLKGGKMALTGFTRCPKNHDSICLVWIWCVCPNEDSVSNEPCLSVACGHDIIWLKTSAGSAFEALRSCIAGTVRKILWSQQKDGSFPGTWGESSKFGDCLFNWHGGN